MIRRNPDSRRLKRKMRDYRILRIITQRSAHCECEVLLPHNVEKGRHYSGKHIRISCKRLSRNLLHSPWAMLYYSANINVSSALVDSQRILFKGQVSVGELEVASRGDH